MECVFLMEEKLPLVSAILPVFNVEHYLEKAVDSLVEQNYPNIEIIIINDGSTDQSEKVASDLAQKYENVIYQTKKNSGAAEARNFGMQLAKGKYLYFMDPDDWLEVNYINELIESAENNDSQLTIGGFTNVYNDGKEIIRTKVYSNKKVYNEKNTFRRNMPTYLNNTLLAVPWNKLYLKSFIDSNNLKFPSVKWDDLHFNLEVIKDISRISIVENTGYQFLRTRPGSETTTVFNESLFENRKIQFSHVLEVVRYWQIDSDDYNAELSYYFLGRIFQVIQEITDSDNLSKKNKLQLINQILVDEMTCWAGTHIGGNKGSIMKFISYTVKNRKVKEIYYFGVTVSFVKKYFSNFFYKLRVKFMKG